MNYQKIYNNIIENAKNRKINGYIEKHHILPKSLGGLDNEYNLVNLTAREHFLCHYLLTKMFKKESFKWYKMVNAFLIMKSSSNKQNRYFNSRLYESLKIDFSKIQSLKQMGRNNSQYGTFWIFNEKLKKSKKVNKQELKKYLENGWKKGRKMSFEEKKKKEKSCSKCGQERCLRPDVCKKHQMINTLIKFFDFDKTKKGNLSFYEEYDRIVKSINEDYHIKKLSTIDLSKKYKVSTQRIDSIFKSLGIKPRTLKEALISFTEKNRAISS